MTSANCNRLVFSDLDGSLLDHYSYQFKDARPAMVALERLDIPLILVSSKTRAEILALRETLANSHPFIVENGAAIHIPVGYFSQQPADTELRDEFWVHAMAPPRSRWLQLLSTLKAEFPAEFDYFHNVGTSGIMAMTGLPEALAIRANQREYSEPVQWLGDANRETLFIRRLEEAGATVARGGRFLAVAGSCCKGRALRWLRDLYQREVAAPDPIKDLAIGDGDNDRSMLEAAQSALLIRSPVHDYPVIARTDGVIYSQDFGPAGWAEGVQKWLHCNKLPA